MSFPSCRAAALTGTLLLIPFAGFAQEGPCGLFEAVEPGDTFTSIAERCGVSLDSLAAANPGVDGSAPGVATTLSLAPGGTVTTPVIAGTLVSPGPKILVAPGSGADVAANPPATSPNNQEFDPADVLLSRLVGQWVGEGEVCADPGISWVITTEGISVGGDVCAISDVDGLPDGALITATCGDRGVTIGRDFTFRHIDGLNMTYLTGEQTGLLTRCSAG